MSFQGINLDATGPYGGISRESYLVAKVGKPRRPWYRLIQRPTCWIKGHREIPLSFKDVGEVSRICNRCLRMKPDSEALGRLAGIMEAEISTKMEQRLYK